MGTYRFEKEHTRLTGIKVNKRTDADIPEYIEKQPDIQGYIRSIIRADIAAHTPGPEEKEGS
ncbi:MAG: hypothetical protein IJH78_04025 [Clostridia bacterium]|nr:hypothetical protein [Clostridia bacterium]